MLEQLVCSQWGPMDKSFGVIRTSQDVFYSTETFSWLRLRLKRRCRIPHSYSAQAFWTMGLTPAGPVALSWFSLSSCLFTWLLEAHRLEGEAEAEVSVCPEKWLTLNSRWANIFHEMVKCLTFSILNIFLYSNVLYITYWCMRFLNNCLLSLFTLYGIPTFLFNKIMKSTLYYKL